MITQYHKFALTASIALAMAFTFSCTPYNGNDNPPPPAAAISSSGDSSSSGGSSSSSAAISSSSSGGSGGSFYSPFTVTAGTNGTALGGIIAANGDGLITSITVTANGTTVPPTNIRPALIGIGTDKVNLGGKAVFGICMLLSATEGTTVKIDVIATFDKGDPISSNASVTIACSPPTPVTRGAVTLSVKDSTFADIDVNPRKAYKTAGITGINAANAAKIDLVAHYSIAGNAVYAPGGSHGAISISFPQANDVVFYDLGATATAAINSITTTAEVNAFVLSPMFDAIMDGPVVKTINIVNGNAFLVLTSDGKFAAVVISNNSGGGTSDATTTFTVTSL